MAREREREMMCSNNEYGKVIGVHVHEYHSNQISTTFSRYIYKYIFTFQSKPYSKNYLLSAFATIIILQYSRRHIEMLFRSTTSVVGIVGHGEIRMGGD